MGTPKSHLQCRFVHTSQNRCAAMAQLHNTATPAQRERALRRLAAYELSLRELNAQR